MIEETVSQKQATENVLIMAERLAFLYYAFAKTLEDELSSDKAKILTLKAIDMYGRLAAESAAQQLEIQGLETTLENFKFGKDLPSAGWESAKIEKPADKPCEKISKITFCPLADSWKKLGDDAKRLGRLYCGVDQAKFKAYGKGYLCFHDKNVLDGDDYCIIRVTSDDSQNNK
ncbi:MAG: L-2-amino-thiazoline-4-carboxylic acid hydrolase [Synergistaceae bacterium]|nr:L-2-amino-thiazoline-4-carboxylic acid hydrolase [Synergistaceae bacterium]